MTVELQKKLLYILSLIAKLTTNSDLKIDKLNLLCEDDCDEMEKFILETKKLNKDEEA